jgi:hypothetical protein
MPQPLTEILRTVGIQFLIERHESRVFDLRPAGPKTHFRRNHARIVDSQTQ